MADQTPPTAAPDWEKLQLRAIKTLESLNLTEDQLHAIVNVITEYAMVSVDAVNVQRQEKFTAQGWHEPGDECVSFVVGVRLAE